MCKINKNMVNIQFCLITAQLEDETWLLSFYFDLFIYFAA